MEPTDLTSSAAILTALLAGTASFLSPCVAPLLPGYVAFVADGATGERSAVLPRAVGFVLGFIALFALAGATAAAASQLLVREHARVELTGGLIVAILGLATLFERQLVPNRFGARLQQASSNVGAPASALAALPVGAAFAVAWTPCIGPVLAAILALAASDARPGWGALLLTTYGIGLGLPFLAGAVALERVSTISRSLRRHARLLHRASGVVLVILGVAIATGGFGAVTGRLAGLVPAWIAWAAPT